MSLSTIYVAPDLEPLTQGNTGQWCGISSAAGGAIVIKTFAGTSRSFTMAAGALYPVMVTEITTWGGGAGDLIGYKVKA
jgi:hypothetical protein